MSIINAAQEFEMSQAFLWRLGVPVLFFVLIVGQIGHSQRSSINLEAYYRRGVHSSGIVH